MQGPLSQTITFVELDKFQPILAQDGNNDRSRNREFSLYYQAILSHIKFKCRCLTPSSSADDSSSQFLNVNLVGKAESLVKNSSPASSSSSAIPVTCTFPLSVNHLSKDEEGVFTLGSVFSRAASDLKSIMVMNQSSSQNTTATATTKFYNPAQEYENRKLAATQAMLQYLASLHLNTDDKNIHTYDFDFILESITIQDLSGSTSIDISPLRSVAAAPNSRLQIEHIQAILSRLKLAYNTRTLKEDISLGTISEAIPTKYCRKCASSGLLDEYLNPEFFEATRKKKNQNRYKKDNDDDDDEQQEHDQKPEIKMKQWYTFSLNDLAKAQQEKTFSSFDESYSEVDTINNRCINDISSSDDQSTCFTTCLLCPNEYFCPKHKGWRHDDSNNCENRFQHIALPINKNLQHTNFHEREDIFDLMQHTFNSPLLGAVCERFERFKNHPFVVTISGDEEEDRRNQILMTYQDVWREAWKMAENMIDTSTSSSFSSPQEQGQVVADDAEQQSATSDVDKNNSSKNQQHHIVICALRDSPERVVAEFASCFATVALLPLHVLPLSSGESMDVTTTKIIHNLVHDVPHQLLLDNYNSASSPAAKTTNIVSILVHPEHEEMIRMKLLGSRRESFYPSYLENIKLVPCSSLSDMYLSSRLKNGKEEMNSSLVLSSPTIPEAFQSCRKFYERLRGPVEIVPFEKMLLINRQIVNTSAPTSSATATAPLPQPSSSTRQTTVKILSPETSNLSEDDDDDNDDLIGAFGVRRKKNKKKKVKRLTLAEQEAIQQAEERRKQEEEELRSRRPVLKNVDGYCVNGHDANNKDKGQNNNMTKELASTAPLLFGLFPTSGSTVSSSSYQQINNNNNNQQLSLSELAAAHLPKLATYNRSTWLRRLLVGQPPAANSTGLFISLQYAPMFHFSARSALWDSLFFGGVRCVVVVGPSSSSSTNTTISSRNSTSSFTDRVLSLLPSVSPTGVFLVPSMWQRLREQWTFLKTSCHQSDVEIAQDLIGRRPLIIGSGTAQCPDDLRQWLKDTVARDACHNIRFKDSYGSTEVGATVTSNGVVQEGVSVELDENNVVWVKYDHMFDGYFKDRFGNVNDDDDLENNSVSPSSVKSLTKKRSSSNMMLKRRASSMSLGRDKNTLEESIAQSFEDPLDKCIQEQQRRNAIPKSVYLLENGYHCTGDYGEWRRSDKKDACFDVEEQQQQTSETDGNNNSMIDLDPREYRTLILLGRANNTKNNTNEVSSSSSSVKLSSGVFCRLDLIEGAAYSVRPRYISQTFAHVVENSFVVLICYSPTIPNRADLDQLAKEVKSTLVGYAQHQNANNTAESPIFLHHHEVPLVVKCVNKIQKHCSSSASSSALFTVENGLLTAAGKIKRHLAADYLREEIETAITEAIRNLQQKQNDCNNDDVDSLTQALMMSKIAKNLGVDIRTIKATNHAMTLSKSNNKTTTSLTKISGQTSDNEEEEKEVESFIQKSKNKIYESDLARLSEDLRVYHPCLMKSDKFVVPVEAAFVGANCHKPIYKIPANSDDKKSSSSSNPFRVLLTGATGHVGASLVVALLELCVLYDHQEHDRSVFEKSLRATKKSKQQHHQASPPPSSSSSSASFLSRPIEIYCLIRYTLPSTSSNEKTSFSSSSRSSSSVLPAAVQQQRCKERLRSAIEPYIPLKWKGHVRDAFERYVKVIPFLSSPEDLAKQFSSSAPSSAPSSAANNNNSDRNEAVLISKQATSTGNTRTGAALASSSSKNNSNKTSKKKKRNALTASFGLPNPNEFGTFIPEVDSSMNPHDDDETFNKKKTQQLSKEELEQEFEKNLNESIMQSLAKFVPHFSATTTPFEVVVHSAAHVDMIQSYLQLRQSNVVFSKIMSSIFASRCKKYILISTTSVNPLHSSIKHFGNFFSHKDEEEEAERELAMEERRKIERRILDEAERQRKEEEEKIKARLRKRLRKSGKTRAESPGSAAAPLTPSPPTTPPPPSSTSSSTIRSAALATTAFNKLRNQKVSHDGSHDHQNFIAESEEQKRARELEEKKKFKREHAAPKMPETEAEILAKELMTIAAGGSLQSESAGGAGVSNGGVGSYAISKAISELVTLATFNEVRSRLSEDESKMVSAAAKAHLERAKLARTADSYDDIVKQMRTGKGGVTSSYQSNNNQQNQGGSMTSVEQKLLKDSTLKELPTLAEVEIIRLPFIWCHTETGASNLKDTFHRFAISVLRSKCAFDPNTLHHDLSILNETRVTNLSEEALKMKKKIVAEGDSSSSALDCFWNFLCVDECAATILEKVFTPSRAQTPPPPPPPLDPSTMTSSPQFLKTFTPRKIPKLQSTIYKIQTSHQLFYRDFVQELKRMSVTTSTLTKNSSSDVHCEGDEFYRQRVALSVQLGFQLKIVDYLSWWKRMFEQDEETLPILPLIELFSRFSGPYFLKRKLLVADENNKDDRGAVETVEEQKRKICLDVLNRNLAWMMQVAL